MRNFIPIIIFCLFICKISTAANLHGKIIDSYSKQPLPGASIQLKNTNYNTVTDADGNYDISNIKAGNYEIVVRFVGFREAFQSFTISDNENKVLNFSLSEEIQSLAGVDVVGTLNKEEETASRLSEKNADNIINVISSKAMEKSPDINVANVLQRMSGITIQRTNGGEGGYAIIRGMEPRYNNTLVNGIKIASPDDKNRFVPLDIVPSDLLKRIEITKSLMPNMEGDAIGGTVNLIMKDAPDTITLKATGSIGYSQIFFDKKYDSFDRSVINQKSPNEGNNIDYEAQPNDFTRNNLKPKPIQAPPNYTLGLTYGKRFYKSKLGFIISGNVQNQYRGIESEFNTVDLDNNIIRKSNTATRFYSSNQRNYGLVAHIDYIINTKNKVGIHNVLLYSDYSEYRFSVDTTLQGDSRTVPGTGLVNYNTRTFTNHQLVENLKIEGNHVLTDRLLLDWAGVISEASKKAPDRAELPVQFRLQNDTAHTPTPFYISLPGISRIWQRNDDKDYSGLLNLTYRKRIFDKNFEFKAGGLYRSKKRYNLQNRYILRPLQDSVGAKVIYNGIDDTGWTIYNPSGTYDEDVNNYTANEEVEAVYLQGKLEWGKWQVLAGTREENTHQYFKTKAITTVTGQVTAEDINYLDVLPSIHFKYLLSSNQNLRLSYFKSISRPNYYELVPSVQRGSDYNTEGNYKLKHTVADNIDFRYEWYPDRESQLLAGVFYKSLINPIEYGLVGLSGGQIVYRPNNYGNAINYGFEIVFSRYFGVFGVLGNYTYTHSAITTPKKYNNPETGKTIDRNQTRSLQGQSDHIANISLLYRNPKNKFFVQLAFQYIGRTLKVVNNLYDTDYYQKPQSLLSLSADKNVGSHFIIFCKLNNLLNTPYILRVGNNDLIVQRDTYKSNYSIGIRYSR